MFFTPEKKFGIKLQSPSKSLWSTLKKAYFLNKDFKKYWLTLNKKNLDKELVDTTNKFLKSESHKWVSRFWNHCQINHFKSISNLSSSESINKNIRDYARHVYFDKNDLNDVCEELKEDINLLNFNVFQKHTDLSKYDSVSYNLTTAILYLRLKNLTDKYYNLINKRMFDKYSYNININGKKINQHFLYTIIELEKISKIFDVEKKNLKILEFGAGYGRTTNLFLSLSSQVKYVIVDIPPAICVSYDEIKKNYPNKKIFSAVDIDDHQSMNDAVEKNDVILVFPHQLKFFKKKYFDLSIMIGVTLEMEPKDVKRYMEYVELLSNNVYLKVFKYSGLPFSFYKVYRHDVREDYFIGKNWKKLFLETGLETDIVSHSAYKVE